VHLQALNLLFCGFEDFFRVNGVYATNDLPIAGYIVLSDEVVEELEGG
jgi:hypothetical protein